MKEDRTPTQISADVFARLSRLPGHLIRGGLRLAGLVAGTLEIAVCRGMTVAGLERHLGGSGEWLAGYVVTLKRGSKHVVRVNADPLLWGQERPGGGCKVASVVRIYADTANPLAYLAKTLTETETALQDFARHDQQPDLDKSELLALSMILREHRDTVEQIRGVIAHRARYTDFAEDGDAANV